VLALAASLNACATEKYEGCPALARDLAQRRNAIVVGTVNSEVFGPSNDTANPPWVSMLYQVTLVRVLRNPLGPIPNTFEVIGKTYIYPPTNDVFGGVFLEPNTLSVMAIRKPSQGAEEYSDFELAKSEKCGN